MNSTIQSRNWRYATKKFDPAKSVSDDDLQTLIEATRLSASSYGLQPYHVFVVGDPKVKQSLREASYMQAQLTDASHVFVFANLVDFGDELIDDYLKIASETRQVPLESLTGYGQQMKSALVSLPSQAKNTWAAKQVYIALGNLLQAAAELKIDSCPLEGIVAAKYDEILGIVGTPLATTVALAVGYRASDDAIQNLAKVRKSQAEMFTLL